jgi:hypothetical protein
MDYSSNKLAPDGLVFIEAMQIIESDCWITIKCQFIKEHAGYNNNTEL